MRVRNITAMSGSPPRMRVIHPKIEIDNTMFGITPAHAGNTTPQREVKTVVEDHPRACG